MTITFVSCPTCGRQFVGGVTHPHTNWARTVCPEPTEGNPMTMTATRWYDDGYALGRAHATPGTNLDPRWSFAEAARAGHFDEFQRGFNEGYDAKRAEEGGLP